MEGPKEYVEEKAQERHMRSVERAAAGLICVADPFGRQRRQLTRTHFRGRSPKCVRRRPLNRVAALQDDVEPAQKG